MKTVTFQALSMTAKSFSRAAARASCKFATFAHASRSTNPTVPSKINRRGRTPPSRRS